MSNIFLIAKAGIEKGNSYPDKSLTIIAILIAIFLRLLTVMYYLYEHINNKKNRKKLISKIKDKEIVDKINTMLSLNQQLKFPMEYIAKSVSETTGMIEKDLEYTIWEKPDKKTVICDLTLGNLLDFIQDTKNMVDKERIGGEEFNRIFDELSPAIVKIYSYSTTNNIGEDKEINESLNFLLDEVLDLRLSILKKVRESRIKYLHERDQILQKVSVLKESKN